MENPVFKEEDLFSGSFYSFLLVISNAKKPKKTNNINFYSPRFLLSIDRRGGPTVAMETVKLAEEFFTSSDGLVVGLDLSGDPEVSNLFLSTVPTNSELQGTVSYLIQLLSWLFLLI